MPSQHDTDFADAALPDHFARFGRTVTFVPATGGARQVTAAIIEDGRDHEEGEHVEEKRERVWLQVRRDESHADGGITSPRVGDAFVHPDETASDDPTPFAFQGEVRHVTSDTWELLFARNRPVGYGGRGRA